jgi:hypothetical protein
MRALLVAALAAALPCGCSRRPSYDRHSPEAALRSFERAVDQGDIPRDLREFIANPAELASWELRCQIHGCASADFTITGTGPAADDRVVLYADYSVVGADRATLMRGRRSPIYFELAGDRWLIEQFGDQIQPAPRPQPTPAPGADPAAPAGRAADPAGPAGRAAPPAAAPADDTARPAADPAAPAGRAPPPAAPPEARP